jgi:hypothetical protein
MRNFIDIVFSGSGPEPSFVEVEDEHGYSIQAGEWIDRGNGYCALRIPFSAFDDDPSVWCMACGVPSKRQCKCPPIPANE